VNLDAKQAKAFSKGLLKNLAANYQALASCKSPILHMLAKKEDQDAGTGSEMNRPKLILKSKTLNRKA